MISIWLGAAIYNTSKVNSLKFKEILEKDGIWNILKYIIYIMSNNKESPSPKLNDITAPYNL